MVYDGDGQQSISFVPTLSWYQRKNISFIHSSLLGIHTGVLPKSECEKYDFSVCIGRVSSRDSSDLFDATRREFHRDRRTRKRRRYRGWARKWRLCHRGFLGTIVTFRSARCSVYWKETKDGRTNWHISVLVCSFGYIGDRFRLRKRWMKCCRKRSVTIHLDEARNNLSVFHFV